MNAGRYRGSLYEIRLRRRFGRARRLAQSRLGPILFVSIFTLAYLISGPPVFATANPPTVLNPDVFSGQTTPIVDGASGALTQHIPIDIPPGRNGLQPDLSLDYNSQNTAEDSIVGYGWSLSIPYIERLNKTGSQNLYGPNAYFTSSLDGELANLSTTTTSTSSSAASGVVSYWKFDGNSNDSVGSVNGTDTSVSYGTSYGKINQGASFNGSSSKTQVNSTNFERGTGDFTIAVWAQAQGAGTGGSDGPTLFLAGDTTSGALGSMTFLSWDKTGGAITFEFYDGSNGATAYVPSGYTTTGVWHYIVAERSGGHAILYIDGTQVAEDSVTFGTPSSANLTTTQYGRIGGDRGTGGGGFFNGYIDEEGFWNRALTPSEITQLFNGGAGMQYPFASPPAQIGTTNYAPRIDEGSLHRNRHEHPHMR
jgi:concanavalin A-like lectin/glucanase superfamily protein/virulence plasmid B protein